MSDDTRTNDDPRGMWKAQKIRPLISNPWFSVLQQAVTRPDGTQADYYTLDFPSPAVGVILRRADQYLLIRQHRFIVSEFVWAIPSGGVHAGETAEQAAIRETAEETGLRVTNIKPLLHYYPTYGCSNQRFELFLADDPLDGDGVFDGNEVIEIRWFTREQVLEMIFANGIVDGLSLTPLAFLFLQEAQGRECGDASTSR
jgi:ADP-ribose pyrophosphatase